MVLINIIIDYESICKCSECLYIFHHNPSEFKKYICECSPIYYLTRIGIIFDEPINKDTCYQISIESDREVLSTDYLSANKIPIADADIFNMCANNELSADDETTIFEPHVAFFEKVLSIKDKVDKLYHSITVDKWDHNGQIIDRSIYDHKMQDIRNCAEKKTISLCPVTSKYNKIVKIIMNKIVHMILQIKIAPLFDDDKKPNPHISKRKKRTN